MEVLGVRECELPICPHLTQPGREAWVAVTLADLGHEDPRSWLQASEGKRRSGGGKSQFQLDWPPKGNVPFLHPWFSGGWGECVLGWWYQEASRASRDAPERPAVTFLGQVLPHSPPQLSSS